MFFSGISAAAVNRVTLFAIMVCGLPALSLAAPSSTKPTTLPGSYQGLTVQCNGIKPLVKVKGKFLDFKKYRDEQIAALKKKIKKKSQLKAALVKRTTELNALEQSLKAKCEDTQNLCFNPRVRVSFKDKTSKCVSSAEAVQLCGSSSLACTNSVPGSCWCEGKTPPTTPSPSAPTATPTPTPTATPTPTPTAGGGSGSPIGGTGPINGYLINMQSIYVNAGYKVFIGNLSGGAGSIPINSFFNSISNNGIIAGGYYVRPKNPSTDGHGIEMIGSTGLHRYDEPNTIIIPFLEHKGRIHEACSFNSCPAGVVLGTVNDLGVAIESQSYSAGRVGTYVFNSPLNYLKPIMSGTTCTLSPIDINSSNVILARKTCLDGSQSYQSLTPQGALPMDLTAVETAYWQLVRSKGLESAKNYARNNLRCPENEVQGTKISSFKSPTQLVASGLNNMGDVYGYLDDLFFEVAFTSPCWEGEIDSKALSIILPRFFTMKRDGSFSFMDDGDRYFIMPPISSHAYFTYPRLNDKRILVTKGHELGENLNVPSRPLAINGAVSGNTWSTVPFTGLPFEDVFPLSLNNRNEMVGFGVNYSTSDPNEWKGTNAHAVASLQGGTKDLNTMMPGSDWILSRANDINDCGEIVGLAYNPKLDIFRGFLLSPTGCR